MSIAAHANFYSEGLILNVSVSKHDDGTRSYKLLRNALLKKIRVQYLDKTMQTGDSCFCVAAPVVAIAQSLEPIHDEALSCTNVRNTTLHF